MRSSLHWATVWPDRELRSFSVSKSFLQNLEIMETYWSRRTRYKLCLNIPKKLLVMLLILSTIN